MIVRLQPILIDIGTDNNINQCLSFSIIEFQRAIECEKANKYY